MIKTKEMKHAALYERVSTDAQFEEGYSIDAQKKQLEAYCISKGIQKFKHYTDGGWSGSTIERPCMEQLVEDIKNGKISHVVVYKLDRLSRSQKDTLYLIEDLFMPNGVDFVSLTESLDTSTPMGRAMIGILAAFAQLERENIRMRTRMGMKERVKDGYWMGGGRIPYGYDYDKNQGILVPNKDADTVRRIYDLYIQGYSGQVIADLLGLKYDKLAIQILCRKSNYGMIEYNGEVYQGRHEPIISKETYDEAMRVMETRKKGTNTSKSLLSGLMVCGKCGAKMYYQSWGSGKYKKIKCYSQQTSKKYLIKDPECNQKMYDDSEVEKEVLKVLFSLKEEKKDWSETELQNSVLNLLEDQKKEIQRKMKRLYNVYAASDDEILLETINELKSDFNRIENKIKQETEALENKQNNRNFKKIIDTLGDQWDTMTNQEKQTVIRILVKEIVFYEDNQIEIKLNI